MPKIVSIEDMPSTVNAWGFGGSIKRKRYILDNNDVWVEGVACYRHLPSQKYIQCRFNDLSFRGGLSADLDEVLRGSALVYIKNFYKK